MAHSTVKVNVNQLVKDMVVTVSLHGVCEFKIRLWAALQLMKLAALISGMRWEILGKPKE